VITIFGTTYFTIGAGFVVLALAAPFLFWFARWLWRPNVEDKPRRVRWLAVGGTTFGLLLLMAVGLFWDVYLIGQRAKELCRETGLVVYRTAPAKSFVGSTDIRFWSRRGIEYLEDTIAGERYRIEMKGTEELRTPVFEFASLYELTPSSGRQASQGTLTDTAFAPQIHTIRNRRSGEIISRVSEYTIGRGWVDRLVVSSTGFFAHPQDCGKDSKGRVVTDSTRVGIVDMIEATLAR
jgi:hypothetical protein